MNSIKITSGALNQTPLDWKGNISRITTAIQKAKSQNADILLLPELAMCSVGCEDAFLSMSLPETALNSLECLLPETEGIFTLLGLPLRVGGTLFNALAAVADGEILGFLCKPFVSSSRLSYESRWFAPWPEQTHWELNLRGKTYPVGDFTLKYLGQRIGVEFCDLPNLQKDEPLLGVERKLDVVLNPAVSPFELGKHRRRKDWIQQRADELGVIYAATNLIGNESGCLLYDGATMIARPDKPISVSSRFLFQDVLLHESAFETMSCEEEFARAVSMGLLDFSRKTHTQGFTLSLSGGADSASIAAIVWIGASLAMEQLGSEKFQQQFPDLPVSMDKLLTCIYQRTKNSSDLTRNAARAVANEVGATFLEFDVAPIVEAYTLMIESAIGETLNWEKHDLSLQNVQARTRGPSAWFIANLQNNLLLVTSNRSEAAVGYATMDGDTCGGLAPISGIDKYFLRHWLRWMQTEGIPLKDGSRLSLATLETVNNQQPTAELRPSLMNQTDETDLMPYEVLEKIEELAVEKMQTPDEILMQLPRLFTMFEKSQLADWVQRFFKLWTNSQWKRERLAPGFHLDSRNLFPRSWCRYPILSVFDETQ